MLRVTASNSAAQLAAAQQHFVADRLSQTEDLARAVLTAEPNNPEALRLLGLVALSTNNLNDAETLIRRAAALAADSHDIWTALGAIHLKHGQIDEMTAAFRKAVALRPDLPTVHCNLGCALSLAGNTDESLACFRRALQLRPDQHSTWSSLLNGLYFHPDCDARAIFEEHRKWNALLAQKWTDAAPPHQRDRSPDRPLRVGYVSPNFRRHAVGRFVMPIFAHHDATQFKIHAYSDLAAPDDVSAKMRTHAHHWQNVAGMSDDQLATLIRNDNLDILVDLSMHLVDNRLLTFARRPAPIQITYLAYCGTTGLSAMDYRISDPCLDPPGGPDEPYYSEKTVRLPSYWCYDRPAEIAPSPIPPFQKNQHITFGCLNNFAKISPATLDTWALLLSADANSHLLLHAPLGTHRNRVTDHFTARGIAPQRISFTPHTTRENYLAHYHSIDIALDPFPHAGGTTTCDALYMGVPVITLRGKTAVGRGGVSILTQMQLTDLIAQTQEDYVRIATSLAYNQGRQAELRATLRDRMEKSPLMDAAGFTRSLESLYRTLWRDWCASSR